MHMIIACIPAYDYVIFSHKYIYIYILMYIYIYMCVCARVRVQTYVLCHFAVVIYMFGRVHA